MNLWIKVGVQVPRRVVPCFGLTLHDNLCSAAVAVFAVHSVTESAVNLHSIIHFQLIPQPIPAQTNYKGHLVGATAKGFLCSLRVPGLDMCTPNCVSLMTLNRICSLVRIRTLSDHLAGCEFRGRPGILSCQGIRFNLVAPPLMMCPVNGRQHSVHTSNNSPVTRIDC